VLENESEMGSLHLVGLLWFRRESSDTVTRPILSERELSRCGDFG
jgi:hypothetical protein